jgi:hypothetical protein
MGPFEDTLLVLTSSAKTSVVSESDCTTVTGVELELEEVPPAMAGETANDIEMATANILLIFILKPFEILEHW